MVINERIQFEKGWYLLYIMVNINSSMPGNRPPLIRHSDSLYLVVWSASHLPHPPQGYPGPQFMNGQGSLDSADKGPSLTGTSRPTPLSIRLHAVKSAAYYLNTWHGHAYRNILSYTQTHSPSPLSPNGYWIGLSSHGISGKEPTCKYRRHKRCGFNPWVRKIPWRSKWQPTPIFLPGESHGQRSLAGCSSKGCKESSRTEAT